MNAVLLVALGGAAGSVLRYVMATAVQRIITSNFPFGTVCVNILGCFLIGLLYIWLIERAPEPRLHLRALLMVGAMGGFTTFSSFSLEMSVRACSADIGSPNAKPCAYSQPS